MAAPLAGLLVAFSSLSLSVQCDNRVQDDNQQQIATTVARKTVLDFLKKHKKIKIEDEDFQGKAKAVEPEKNLKVKVEDLELGYGTATASLLLAAPFRVEGKLNQEKEELSVSGEVDLAIKLKMIAHISELDGNVRISAKCEELKCEVKKVRDLQPPNFSGAKRLIEEICHRQSDVIKRSINEWLNKNVIDPNEEE